MKSNPRAIGVVAAVLGIATLTSCSSAKTSAGTTATTVTTPTSATTSTSIRERVVGRPIATSTTTPTTTATRIVSAPSGAVSATFVSPDHGWAIANDGRVDETTDGGHRWRRVGVLASRGPGETIRFIGSSDGFAFGRGQGALLITHDGGSSWIRLDTPFSNVADLAIARGKVYAVALKSGNPVDFQIWSTPVGHLVWRRDALVLPVGAGPVPSQEIVLAGRVGWILDEDRTVIAGARLASSGSWAKWSPPCLHVEGPAYLSASTVSDSVATCDEGVWGGNYPKIAPAVYFSHDGGTTFVRHPAPAFGPALSPNAQTAIVAGGETLQRTTDGGTTWNLVAHIGHGETTDWGFTTSTQGFVISGGNMLMTYDAGATWTRVTLP